MKLQGAVKVLRRLFSAESQEEFDAVRARLSVFDLAAKKAAPLPLTDDVIVKAAEATEREIAAFEPTHWH